MKNVIIELYVAMTWDARTHRVFTHAPDDWATMSIDERDKFLQEAADEWADGDLEIGAVVYDDPSEIDNSRWGDSYDESSVENMFDSTSASLRDDENVGMILVDPSE